MLRYQDDTELNNDCMSYVYYQTKQILSFFSKSI